MAVSEAQLMQKLAQHSLPLGIYQHYKGNKYQVLGACLHSETKEVLILYRPMYGAAALWVRPAAMFAEKVEVKGKTLARFRFIEAADSSL